ncbi:hypothetical protein GCM10020229_51420 [Kitasatospora albolonga]
MAVVRGIGLDGLTDGECVRVAGRYLAGLGTVRARDPARRPTAWWVAARHADEAGLDLQHGHGRCTGPPRLLA